VGGNETISSGMSQCWFVAGPILKNISLISSWYFSTSLPLVSRFSNIPAVAVQNVTKKPIC